MKKGLLPALRKKHRLTAPECDGGPEESPVEERPRDVLMVCEMRSEILSFF